MKVTHLAYDDPVPMVGFSISKASGVRGQLSIMGHLGIMVHV